MVDFTQKTTKGVREAPTAPEAVSYLRIALDYAERKQWQAAAANAHEAAKYAAIAEKLEKFAPKPRYTVELTTEGWQIKDNVKGTIGAEVFAARSGAEAICDHANDPF